MSNVGAIQSVNDVLGESSLVPRIASAPTSWVCHRALAKWLIRLLVAGTINRNIHAGGLICPGETPVLTPAFLVVHRQVPAAHDVRHPLIRFTEATFDTPRVIETHTTVRLPGCRP